MVAALQGKRWQWEQTVYQGSATVTTNPAAYTIVFNPEGTFNAIIDCNSASGTYTADELGRIQMQLGPMTSVECGPESRAQEMINMINAVQSYRYEEGGVVLIFVWPANGPLDYYRNAGPA
jgi:heat shock protein HslJ